MKKTLYHLASLLIIVISQLHAQSVEHYVLKDKRKPAYVKRFTLYAGLNNQHSTKESGGPVYNLAHIERYSPMIGISYSIPFTRKKVFLLSPEIQVAQNKTSMTFNAIRWQVGTPIELKYQADHLSYSDQLILPLQYSTNRFNFGLGAFAELAFKKHAARRILDIPAGVRPEDLDLNSRGGVYAGWRATLEYKERSFQVRYVCGYRTNLLSKEAIYICLPTGYNQAISIDFNF